MKSTRSQSRCVHDIYIHLHSLIFSYFEPSDILASPPHKSCSLHQWAQYTLTNYYENITRPTSSLLQAFPNNQPKIKVRRERNVIHLCYRSTLTTYDEWQERNGGRMTKMMMQNLPLVKPRILIESTSNSSRIVNGHSVCIHRIHREELVNIRLPYTITRHGDENIYLI